jgi:hypothetical protein
LAVGVAVPFLTNLFLPKEANSSLVMTIFELSDVGASTIATTSTEDAALREYRGATLAKTCGVDQFHLSFPTHGGAQTDVELGTIHENALACIVENAAEQGIPLGFKRTPALDAQTH